MCIGLPMRVLSSGPGYAVCEGMGETRRVDTLLVGDPAPGSWLLVFLDSAREVISESTAGQISAALQAVQMAMQGDAAVDHLFADLADREPPLPDFLRSVREAPEPGESS